MPVDAPVKNIFMIGLSEYNREELRSISSAESYQFHSLTDPAQDAEYQVEFDVPEILTDLEKQLFEFKGSIDAITTYLDLPYSMITPLLCEQHNLSSASLHSILKCHHKYWGRTQHKQIIPDATPDFNVIDPFAEEPYSGINLKYPFWLKPIKSMGSFLGFQVNDPKDFQQAIDKIRDEINWTSSPFDEILKLADLPEEIKKIPAHYCIAEQLMSGVQCTLEDYVFNGEVTIHGVIDSLYYPNSLSFSYFLYPSRLPKQVQARMTAIATEVLKYIGYDNNAFNIEFFWDEAEDKVWLIEINTRISQAHSKMFQHVDGMSNLLITVELGLGRDPKFPHRMGEYKHAGKFFLRSWNDAIVERVPSEGEIQAIEQTIPGVSIDIRVLKGLRLSDMRLQDSYSYELAWINVAANSHSELINKYDECVKKLDGFLFIKHL